MFVGVNHKHTCKSCMHSRCCITCRIVYVYIARIDVSIINITTFFCWSFQETWVWTRQDSLASRLLHWDDLLSCWTNKDCRKIDLEVSSNSSLRVRAPFWCNHWHYDISEKRHRINGSQLHGGFQDSRPPSTHLLRLGQTWSPRFSPFSTIKCSSLSDIRSQNRTKPLIKPTAWNPLQLWSIPHDGGTATYWYVAKRRWITNMSICLWSLECLWTTTILENYPISRHDLQFLPQPCIPHDWEFHITGCACWA